MSDEDGPADTMFGVLIPGKGSARGNKQENEGYACVEADSASKAHRTGKRKREEEKQAPVFAFALPQNKKDLHMSVCNPKAISTIPGERMTVQPGSFAPL